LLITFAIPVFNDSDGLRKTLSTVLAALHLDPERIEILVSDNHSDDNSFEVAQTVLSGIAGTRAIKQDSNLGFSGNLRSLTELANGEYIWFLAAGDFLVPDQVPFIIDALLEKRPDFGVVNGTFEYHDNWQSLPVSRSYIISSSRETSSTPLFNHAVSLNILSRKVMTHYFNSRFVSLEDAKVKMLHTVIPSKAALDEPICHWPHLEAVSQAVTEKGPEPLKWVEYRGLSVVLGRNVNGSWDKKTSAIEVFSQWAAITRLTHEALPTSDWLAEMNSILHGKHLLAFLFMLRKDETVGRLSTFRQTLAMPVKLHVKAAALIIVLLPKSIVSLLVLSRGLVLKTTSLWSRINHRPPIV
jgi:glycosyltransferase involved in cell wall biosynthesis